MVYHQPSLTTILIICSIYIADPQRWCYSCTYNYFTSPNDFCVTNPDNVIDTTPTIPCPDDRECYIVRTELIRMYISYYPLYKVTIIC